MNFTRPISLPGLDVHLRCPWGTWVRVRVTMIFMTRRPSSKKDNSPKIVSQSRLILFVHQIFPSVSRSFMSSSAKPTNGSKILSKSPLSANEAKWTRLVKIDWQDPSGKQRIWESAERSTRSKGGIDGTTHHCWTNSIDP